MEQSLLADLLMIRATLIKLGQISPALFLPTAKRTTTSPTVTVDNSKLSHMHSCLAVNEPLVAISEQIAEEGVSTKLPSLIALAIYQWSHARIQQHAVSICIINHL